MLYFLSGLPRSGSTLLSSILSQNPDIYAEGNSALCTLMWDAQQSCEENAWQQLAANRRYDDQDAICRAVAAVYYRKVNASYIVDKCRSWTIPANMQMIRRYLTPDPRVIVLVRPIDQVLDSFRRLHERNGVQFDVEQMRIPGSEPIMRSQLGIDLARQSNDPAFLFVEYHDLCDRPEETLALIYEHCDWPYFAHDFENVINHHPEDDTVYGLPGMHEIERKVRRGLLRTSR